MELDPKNLQEVVDRISAGTFSQKRFVLASQHGSSINLPYNMTWRAASTIASAAAKENRVELMSWGYEEWRCLMVYGEVSTANKANIPLRDWSLRKLSYGDTFESCVAAVGGWDADVSELAGVISSLPERMNLIVVEGLASRVCELLATRAGRLRPTILQAESTQSRPFHSDVEIVVFDDLSGQDVHNVIRAARDDGTFRFAVCSTPHLGRIDKLDAIKLLMLDGSDYLVDQVLDKFRWFVIGNCYDESGLWISFHGTSGDAELMAIRRRLVEAFAEDRAITW